MQVFTFYSTGVMRERQEKNPSECQVFFCDNNDIEATCETENKFLFYMCTSGTTLTGSDNIHEWAICYLSITLSFALSMAPSLILFFSNIVIFFYYNDEVWKMIGFTKGFVQVLNSSFFSIFDKNDKSPSVAIVAP